MIMFNYDMHYAIKQIIIYLLLFFYTLKILLYISLPGSFILTTNEGNSKATAFKILQHNICLWFGLIQAFRGMMLNCHIIVCSLYMYQTNMVMLDILF